MSVADIIILQQQHIYFTGIVKKINLNEQHKKHHLRQTLGVSTNLGCLGIISFNYPKCMFFHSSSWVIFFPSTFVFSHFRKLEGNIFSAFSQPEHCGKFKFFLPGVSCWDVSWLFTCWGISWFHDHTSSMLWLVTFPKHQPAAVLYLKLIHTINI